MGHRGEYWQTLFYIFLDVNKLPLKAPNQQSVSLDLSTQCRYCIIMSQAQYWATAGYGSFKHQFDGDCFQPQIILYII